MCMMISYQFFLNVFLETIYDDHSNELDENLNKIYLNRIGIKRDHNGKIER